MPVDERVVPFPKVPRRLSLSEPDKACVLLPFPGCGPMSPENRTTECRLAPSVHRGHPRWFDRKDDPKHRVIVERGNGVGHGFKVGQLVAVHLTPRVGGGEVHEVIRLMPEDATGSPQYRVKSLTLGTERQVRESEISPYVPPHAAR